LEELEDDLGFVEEEEACFVEDGVEDVSFGEEEREDLDEEGDGEVYRVPRSSQALLCVEKNLWICDEESISS